MTNKEKKELEDILDDMYRDNDDIWYIERLVDTIKKMINYKRKEKKDDND